MSTQSVNSSIDDGGGDEVKVTVGDSSNGSDCDWDNYDEYSVF